MIVLDFVEVTLTSGVSGDHRGKPGTRQVTVLEQQAWEATCLELDEFYFGLQEKLEASWRGGVTCRVIRPGMIYLENEVSMTDDKD